MLRYDQLNYLGKVAYHDDPDDPLHTHVAPSINRNGNPQAATGNNVGGSAYTWEQWEDPSQPGAAYSMRMEGTTLAGFGTQEGAAAYRSYYTEKQPGGAQPLYFKDYDPSAWEIVGTGKDVPAYQQYETEDIDKPSVVSSPELLPSILETRGWKDEDPRNPAWGTYDDPASVRLHGMALDTELAERYGTGAVYAGKEIEIGTRVDLGDGKIGELTPIGWRFEEDIEHLQFGMVREFGVSGEGKQPVISLSELQRQVTTLEEDEPISGTSRVSPIAPDATTATTGTTESVLGPQPDVTFYEKFIKDYRSTVLDADIYQADDATKAELERIANIRFPHQQHYEETK